MSRFVATEDKAYPAKPPVPEEIQDAIRTLIHRGGKVMGIKLTSTEQRYDIGNFESYYAAFVDFALADPKYGPGLREHLKKVL